MQLVPEQVYAAFLKKMKGYFTDPNRSTDVVLSIPPYYSAVERQAVLDACKIANVKCLRLINENTAVCLAYGFYNKKTLGEKEARNVAFVDFGHGKTTVTIASFTQKKVKIINYVTDRNMGARDMDQLIMTRLGGEFEEQYGCDPREAPKCVLRMLAAIENARKILSANSDAAVNVECLLEDEDLHRNLNREEFETTIQPAMDKFEAMVTKCLANSGKYTIHLDFSSSGSWYTTHLCLDTVETTATSTSQLTSLFMRQNQERVNDLLTFLIQGMESYLYLYRTQDI